MSTTYVRLNDVTYELASDLNDEERRALAERLAARAGEEKLEVLLPDRPGVAVELFVDLSRVWASGVGHQESVMQVF